MSEIILISSLIFVLIMAVVAVQIRDLLSSVMALGGVGFGLAIIFMFLAAPEVMTAQLVVEVICFTIMVAVVFKTSKIDKTRKYSVQEISPAAAMFFFGIIFVIFVIWGIKELPMFGSPLMRTSSLQISKTVSEIGATNIVTAILLDFRAWNTLIEAVIIITMIIGVAVILRKKGKKLIR
ncbi:MAG: hydrogenase subunit MbhD domain-containing protein [Elusimicrobiota bacterium]